jgi:hypothetical protein
MGQSSRFDMDKLHYEVAERSTQAKVIAASHIAYTGLA